MKRPVGKVLRKKSMSQKKGIVAHASSSSSVLSLLASTLLLGIDRKFMNTDDAQGSGLLASGRDLQQPMN